MSTEFSYSVLLVNYKTRHLTSLCLDLLKQHMNLKKTDVIVVDNDSKDDSLDYLRALDWIRLIERKPDSESEPPHVAHARALDLGMESIRSDYVLLLHSDTLIHNADIIDYLFTNLNKKSQTFAAGSVDQRNRNQLRRFWRFAKKMIRYGKATLGGYLGMPGKKTKPIRDNYLKSYCCLWDARVIRKHRLKFYMNGKNPGYAMQDFLLGQGYRMAKLPARSIFKFLDHVQSGTTVETGQTMHNKRRNLAYNRLLGHRLSKDEPLKIKKQSQAI